MKLPTTIGFEMTGIISDYNEREYAKSSNSFFSGGTTSTVTRAMATLVAANLVKVYPNYSVRNASNLYVDGHCLEFPSPVCRSTEEMDKFFLTLNGLFRKYNVTARNPQTVCGGNHMHFGVSVTRDAEMIQNIFRDFSERYYIPWVFTQPDDTDSCRNLKFYESLFNCQSWGAYLNNDETADKMKKYDNYYWLVQMFNLLQRNLLKGLLSDVTANDKTAALVLNRPNGNRNTTTLEFRCIEAPASHSEFKDQYEFFLAYYNYASKLVDVPPVQFWCIDDVQRIEADEAAWEFYLLLDTLKLDRKRYKKYVNRNLYPRWELNRKRI